MSKTLREISQQISWASVLALAFWAWGMAHAGVDVWTPIGPVNVQVSTVVTDPSSSARLYATLGSSDLYTSDDSGAIWTRIAPAQPATPECSPPTSPLAVQSDGSVYVITCTGLFKSTDAGASWAPLGFLNIDHPVGDPTNPMVLYVLSSEPYSGTLFKTTNGGRNWSQIDVNTGGRGLTQLVVDAALPSRLYALSWNGVYKSVDSGSTWTPINAGLPAAASFNSLALLGSTLFVGTNGFGVYKKGADEISWVSANNGISTKSIAIVRTGSGSMLYAASNYGAVTANAALFKSSDGGASWFPTGTLNTQLRDLAVSRQSDSILYAATIDGLATSNDDGASWTFDPDNGLPNAPALVYVDAYDPSILYTNSGSGGYRSVDRGADWSPLVDADGSHFIPRAVSPSRSGTVYAETPCTTFGCGIRRSTDFGSNWTFIFGTYHQSVTVVLEAPDPAGALFIFGWGYGGLGFPTALFVVRSDDGGVNWSDASGGLPRYPDYRNDVSVSAAAMARSNADVLYAAVNDGVYKTVNGGGTWVKASGVLPQSHMNALAVSRTQPNTVFAGLGDGLYRSDDGGTTWGPRNTAFVNLAVTALAIDPNNPSNVYAGTGGGGLYRSTDGGASFRPINNGLNDINSLSVNDIAIEPVYGRNLYIGTSGGAFALTIDRYDSFVPVIEFYNHDLDHYFMASETQADVPALDSGAFAGWARTGQTFKAYPQPTGAAQPVCRFYIPPQHGNSHFYSASTSECTAVLNASTDPQNPGYPNYSGYAYETAASFYVDVPDNGSCPFGELPVYRLWNQRPDSNHRYTTDPAIRDAMIAKGYVLEGAVMCALL